MPEKRKHGWENAPQLNRLTSAQQGGNRGAQLWGVQVNGTMDTIYQITPGGDWSPWLGSDWAGPGYPKGVNDLTAAQASNLVVQFWGLDVNLELWTTSQITPGGSWVPWQGPRWNNAPKGMKRLAACRQAGTKGTLLWGIAEDYSIINCYQQTQGGPQWSNWQPWQATPQKSQFAEIAAAEQEGHAQLWGLDTDRQLWFCWQTSPGSSWTEWHGPNWGGAPKLVNITACQQGGTRGSQVWGITEDYTLISNYQITPGGQWSGWSTGSWLNAPQVHEITAAEQNNGCVRFWALTLHEELISIGQTSPGGDWGDWSPVGV